MGTTSNPRVANPIALRRLSVVGEPGRQVVVAIGKPRPEPDPTVWRCPYVVEGIPKARRRFAHGVDSLQAFQMAIEGARHDLLASGLVLTCESGAPGDIGFPRLVLPYPPETGLNERIDRFLSGVEKEFQRMAKARSDARDGAESK